MRMIASCLALALTGCATGPMTQEERDNADRTIKALQILQASPWGSRPAPTPVDLSPRPATTSTLVGQHTQGYTRYCVYRNAEGTFSIPTGLASVCPQSF